MVTGMFISWLQMPCGFILDRTNSIPQNISTFRCFSHTLLLLENVYVPSHRLFEKKLTYKMAFLGTTIQISLDCSLLTETSAFMVRKTTTGSWTFKKNYFDIYFYTEWLGRLSYCTASQEPAQFLNGWLSYACSWFPMHTGKLVYIWRKDFLEITNFTVQQIAGGSHSITAKKLSVCFLEKRAIFKSWAQTPHK